MAQSRGVDGLLVRVTAGTWQVTCAGEYRQDGLAEGCLGIGKDSGSGSDQLILCRFYGVYGATEVRAYNSMKSAFAVTSNYYLSVTG
jgi:hypothetical protein